MEKMVLISVSPCKKRSVAKKHSLSSSHASSSSSGSSSSSSRLVRSLSETFSAPLAQALSRSQSRLTLADEDEDGQAFHKRFLNFEWRFGEVNFCVSRF